MVLIVGGAYQGKGDFALELSGGKKENVLLNIHERIEALFKKGYSREEIESAILAEATGEKEMILTADEIGCGIVPLDEKLRECREITGRILCVVAKEAGEVYRMTAGIPVKIKG